MDISAEVKLGALTIHFSHFLCLHSLNYHPFRNSPSFNARIFTSLGSIRDSINKLMQTKRILRNCYSFNHFLSDECLNYVCNKLKGVGLIVDG